MQRARYTAERAYRPDARALAVIYINRAEVLRIATATTSTSEAVVLNSAAGSGVKESLKEVFTLHERGAVQLANASWKVQKDAGSWSSHGGNVEPVVVQELLWAKALASQAAAMPAPQPPKRRNGSPLTARKRLVSSRSRASDGSFSLPEKMVPTEGVALKQDALLNETCPARAAAARAWRALCAAANEPIPREKGGGDLWAADSNEARRLAALVGQGATQSQLLLEVAVLVFTMGCRLGRRSWARAVAAPLAEIASKQFDSLNRSNNDQSALAARHTAAVLAGAAVPEFKGAQVSRDSLLSTHATQDEGNDTVAPAPWMRWRLVGYIATEELWILRIGTRRTVHLAAPPPLTWFMEGLALSETTPEAEDNSA